VSFPITGTLLNTVTVIVGGTLGTMLGNRMPEQMRQTVLQGLGLITLVIGISMAITTRNILIPLFSVLVGGMLGEMLDLSGGLECLGQWSETQVGRLARRRRGSIRSALDLNAAATEDTKALNLAQGFITASLIFCIGPLAVMGSLQDGLIGDYSLLAIKAVMDGFASIALAASLGAGVILSAASVLAVQGALSILALLLGTALGGVTRTTPWVVEMTATGGVVVLSIALMLLDVKRMRTANLVPAILAAPLIVVVLGWLHISF
jgi:uncharacterized protein